MHSCGSDTDSIFSLSPPAYSMGFSSCQRQDDFPKSSAYLTQAGGFVGVAAETSKINGQDMIPFERGSVRNGTPYAFPGGKHFHQIWMHHPVGPKRLKLSRVGKTPKVVKIESGTKEESTIHRLQANNRERERTMNLNVGFTRLGRIVPRLPSDKLCKRQILQLAIRYINFLTDMMREDFVWEYDDHPWQAGSLLTHERLSNAFCMSRLKGAWANESSGMTMVDPQNSLL